MGKAKQQFTPRPGRPSDVSMYCCGVTVYDLSHIGDMCAIPSRARIALLPSLLTVNTHAGHGRVYCVFDMLYRVLRELGFCVEYVRNVTDIDDKILRRAAEQGEDPLQLSGRWVSWGCWRHARAPALSVTE